MTRTGPICPGTGTCSTPMTKAIHGRQGTISPALNYMNEVDNPQPQRGCDALRRLQRLVVDPNNKDVAYYGSSFDGLYRTTDGGVNWSKLTSGLPHRAEGRRQRQYRRVYQHRLRQERRDGQWPHEDRLGHLPDRGRLPQHRWRRQLRAGRVADAADLLQHAPRATRPAPSTSPPEATPTRTARSTSARGAARRSRTSRHSPPASGRPSISIRPTRSSGRRPTWFAHAFSADGGTTWTKQPQRKLGHRHQGCPLALGRNSTTGMVRFSPHTPEQAVDLLRQWRRGILHRSMGHGQPDHEQDRQGHRGSVPVQGHRHEHRPTASVGMGGGRASPGTPMTLSTPPARELEDAGGDHRWLGPEGRRVQRGLRNGAGQHRRHRRALREWRAAEHPQHRWRQDLVERWHGALPMPVGRQCRRLAQRSQPLPHRPMHL